MKHESFADLPGALKRLAAQFGWSHDDIELWLRRPIPALADRSVLEALDDGDYPRVYQVFLRTADACGVEGAPEDLPHPDLDIPSE